MCSLCKMLGFVYDFDVGLCIDIDFGRFLPVLLTSVSSPEISWTTIIIIFCVRDTYVRIYIILSDLNSACKLSNKTLKFEYVQKLLHNPTSQCKIIRYLSSGSRSLWSSTYFGNGQQRVNILMTVYRSARTFRRGPANSYFAFTFPTEYFFFSYFFFIQTRLSATAAWRVRGGHIAHADTVVELSEFVVSSTTENSEKSFGRLAKTAS